MIREFWTAKDNGHTVVVKVRNGMDTKMNSLLERSASSLSGLLLLASIVKAEPDGSSKWKIVIGAEAQMIYRSNRQ
jgi:hypothetical protein